MACACSIALALVCLALKTCIGTFSAARMLQDEARQLLAEGDFFQSAPVLETSPAARMPLQGVAADADQDDDLDQFLAPLPGADTETDMVNRLMSPDRDEEDTDDS